MKNILLIGKMGSGKTTVAKYLEKMYSYKIVSLADPIKEIARDICGMEGKDRNLLQTIGKVGRAINPTVWIDMAKNKILESNTVIDDCRFENEFDRLVFSYCFIPVIVTTDEDLRIIRLVKSGQEVSRKYLDDSSEQEVDSLVRLSSFYAKYGSISYFYIDNNSTIEDLYANVDGVIKNIHD